MLESPRPFMWGDSKDEVEKILDRFEILAMFAAGDMDRGTPFFGFCRSLLS